MRQPFYGPAMATALLSACCLLGLVGDAHAGDDRKAQRAQQARIQQLQQAAQALEAEKGQLHADKGKLEEQLRSSRSELDKARSAVSRREAQARREAEVLSAQQATLRQQLDEAQKEVALLKERLKDSLKSGGEAHDQFRSAQAALVAQTTVLAACEQKNEALFQLNTSLVARLEKAADGGFWKGGVLTHLGRVERENEVAALGDQLEAQRVTPTVKP
jgi:predicted RNase H-like nuclease (RuvC/YqgF family)